MDAIAVPWTLRVAEWASRVLVRAGLAGRLDEDALIDAAARRTGLSDFGEPSFRVGLRVLLDSIEDDAHLTAIGRVLARAVTLAALENRLRFVDARARSPDALAAPLRKPVVIACMPRTGSTLLQRLLCEAPNAMFLPMWLLMEPMPPPSPALWAAGGGDRLRRAKLGMALQDWLAPGIELRHEIRAEVPEEDTFLFMASFVSLEYWAVLPVHGYARWLVRQPAGPPYRWFREHLQLLQASVPGDHWVLKSPMHFVAIDALLDELPEATVVMLHRDPMEVVPSSHSLFEAVHRAVSHAPDLPRMVAFNTRMLAEAAERLAERRDAAGDRIIDVGYRRLVRDPIGTVRDLHDRCGLPWDDAHEARMRAWLASNPQHKHGKHRYSLARYGQDPDRVADMFRGYRERFGPWLR